MTSPNDEALLRLSQLDKSFFTIPVLRQVSLELHAGEALGLVGENGAGKSTLMNILGGNLAPDGGQMTLGGVPYQPRSPRDAERAGVAFIHQELNLFPNLSIAENIFVTRFPRRWLGIDRRQMRRRTRELLDEVGLVLPPDMRVDSLSAGERQLVEIAKALRLEPRILILDEPTTSLSATETERLFALLRRLQQRGIAMIYISHALDEVRRLCNRVMVLRDGSVVGEGPIEQFDHDRLVTLMVGRQVERLFPARAAKPTTTAVLVVRDVSQPGVVERVSFALHEGEVLGISGLMGSGRTELARILFGLDPLAMGSIELAGQRIDKLTTRGRVRAGMALLTESRHEDGLCLAASIRFNLGLVVTPRFSAGGWLRQGPLSTAAESMGREVRLTGAADHRRAVRTLSGGNQQKVVLGKWLLNEPRVFLLDEPTRGIDVGAKYEVYSLIDRLAAGGAGVLVISSEIEELMGICDRILVMGQGEIRDEIPRDQFDRERILQASLRQAAKRGAAV